MLGNTPKTRHPITQQRARIYSMHGSHKEADGGGGWEVQKPAYRFRRVEIHQSNVLWQGNEWVRMKGHLALVLVVVRPFRERMSRTITGSTLLPHTPSHPTLRVFGCAEIGQLYTCQLLSRQAKRSGGRKTKRSPSHFLYRYQVRTHAVSQSYEQTPSSM